MQTWIYLALAAAAGVCMAVQGSMNGALGKIIGVLEGSFVLHAVGLVLVALLLFVLHLGKGDFSRMGEAPWYLYLGGVLNVAIIFGVMLAVGKCGAGPATTAIICGQLAMAMIVDRLGLFGLEQSAITWGKVLGLVMMVAGGRLMLGSG